MVEGGRRKESASFEERPSGLEGDKELVQGKNITNYGRNEKNSK